MITSSASSISALAHVSVAHPQSKNNIDIFSSQPRRILVLYVGGTVGMKKNREGALEPFAGYLTGEMHKMHELKESTEIAPFDIIEYEKLLDSSDMNATDYLRIASDVQTHYDSYDGFLIAHGTDTMHYTASALSFLLHNLAKPVIITGAMVPLAEPYNDARRNLVISMMIASNPKICEVCIFFNDQLFRGNRCDKVYHTYGAFQSPNYPALGVMEATSFVLKERYLLPQPTGAMSILSNLKGTVMVFDLPPDADVETILAVMRTTKQQKPTTEVGEGRPSVEGATSEGGSGERPLLDAAVLVLRGVGSIKGVMADALRSIAKVAEQKDIVTVVTQPEVQGTFSPVELARLRATSPSLVYAADMTKAAAEMKLMYLFGKGLRPKQVAEYMVRNLRGEITPPRVDANL